MSEAGSLSFADAPPTLFSCLWTRGIISETFLCHIFDKRKQIPNRQLRGTTVSRQVAPPCVSDVCLKLGCFQSTIQRIRGIAIYTLYKFTIYLLTYLRYGVTIRVFVAVGEAAGIACDVITDRRLLVVWSRRRLCLWVSSERWLFRYGSHHGWTSPSQHKSVVTGRSGRLHPVSVRMRIAHLDLRHCWQAMSRRQLSQRRHVHTARILH